MPELPEVETVKRYLEPRLNGLTLERIEVYRDANFIGGSDSFKVLEGHRINRLGRKGKFLLFFFDESHAIISHLRMEGKWFLKPKQAPREKHDIARFILNSEEDLIYNDTRKFGIMILADQATMIEEAPLSELGKEPWELSKEELLEGLSKRHGTIKEALLDQSLIAGLGNIYVDETLFASGISPRMEASKTDPNQAEEILIHSRAILEKAISLGGSTVHSYLFAPGARGKMQDALLIYGKEGEKCPKCGTPFRKIAIKGRGTTYCPICQSDKDRPLVYAVTGPIAAGKSTVADYLKEKGYEVLDADALVAGAYKDETITAKLEKELGTSDKKSLAKSASDPLIRKKLENILHPYVYERMLNRIHAKKGGKILLDIPLWKGSPLEEETDFLIFVGAKEEVRRERLIQRGKDPDLYLSINGKYPSNILAKKASLALDGSGSVQNLRKILADCPYL